RARINRRFSADFMVAQGAFAATVYPLVSVEESGDVEIRDLTLDGNGANNPRMNGCRGAAVYGLFGHGAHVAGVTVRHFHGDALSFQHSHEWVVEDCLFEDNLGGGMHPGSGSKRPIIRRCISRRNAGWGLFVCWRVKGARYEDNLLEHNGAGGISIGHKDTDNLFLRNRVRDNAGAGICVRDEIFPMAPHRGLYRENIVTGNNGGGPQVVLAGAVHDLRFIGNVFDPAETPFAVGPGVVNLVIEEAAGADQ
ncbi:MAG TPA: right-handed parallel beta-helix repeat-containing protein, partial [Armatimonadota bacterium]|nr:right-handed parallel beta-helix repeat-containing protein [Armatimonadota bacterium]